MFKNCCGCKNSQAVIGEAYEPKQNVVTVEKNQEPVVVVTPPADDVPVVKSPQEVKKPPAPPQVEVDEVKDEDEGEEEEEEEKEQQHKVVVPPDLTGPSRQGSVEMDTVDLQAVARGMIATPHPSKRGSGVPNLAALPQWLSQEDDDIPGEGGGTAEPPATPVGRDELALRRHRFFSDLLQAHQAGAEHRVRFDPLGPTVAGGGADTESEPRTPAIEFENLLSRLERVTARLEQTVEVATGTILLSQTASRLTQEQEDKAPPPPPPLPPPPSPPPQPPDTMSVEGFSNIIRGPLAQFLQLSQKIGGDVATQAEMVRKAFDAQLEFLEIASKSSSPANQAETMKLLVPTSTHIVGIQEYREKNRGSNHFNHLSAVSESIAALGWVTVSPAPAPYVKEMNDAGQFYTNRVLKDWKEKDKTHVDWVKSWIQILTELQQFVKQHHTTGLVWGGRGGAAPPPPPPGVPPPPPVLPVGDVAPTIDSAAQDRSALFAEINRGEGITSTLKRVTPDMQTHKNPALRAGPAPFKAPATSTTHKPVSAPKPVDKPPTFYKDGKKWMVEYQQGNHSLVVDQVEMNNVVYMYNCRDSTLTVKGKINSVVLDSCRKSSVVFDTLVSSIEFVNCQSVQMQVLGKVPTISIDKTDGCQMYLNSESMDVEIISSKSSEMNVLVPKGNGDYAEYPIPEQFKTTVRPDGLSTIAIENKG